MSISSVGAQPIFSSLHAWGKGGSSSTSAASATSQYNDTLDISAGASLAADLLAGSEPVDELFSRHGSIRLEDIGEQAKQHQETVTEMLNSLFAANGIDTSTPVQLHITGDGKLAVANNHPQAEKINELLSGESELRNVFARLSANSSLMRAAKEAEAFQRAYARDPVAALKEFQHLFEEGAQAKQPTFRLSFQDGATESLFVEQAVPAAPASLGA